MPRADPAPRPDPQRGVFETLLVADGRVHALDAHLRRLENSVRTLYGLTVPEDSLTRVVDALDEAARRPGEQRARIDATPAGGRLELGLTLGPAPAAGPVALQPVLMAGGLGAHKWRDRRLVERDRAGATAPTPLLVDADGSVLEAGWANVWLLDGDELITPPADGRILPGVTRARLLELASGLSLRAREEPIPLQRARAAPALFLTSSLRLAVPASLAPGLAEHPDVARIRSALMNS